MNKFRYLASAAIAICTVGIAMAQITATKGICTREEIAAWSWSIYDAGLSQRLDAIVTDFQTVGDMNAFELTAFYNEAQDAVEQLAALPYPNCVSYLREHDLARFSAIVELTELFGEDSSTTVIFTNTPVFQLIKTLNFEHGITVGYLAGYGFRGFADARIQISRPADDEGE